MKPLPSNALRTQLAQSQPAGPHPDAGLLTAFAENTLLDHERTNVLAHLAACPTCRAILSAAAEPEAAPAPASRPARLPIPTWLPGVALAASLLVMAATTVLFYRALHTRVSHTQTATSAPPQLPPAPASAAPAPQISAAASAAPAAPLAAPKHPRKSSHPTPPAAAPTLATEEAQLGAAAPPPPPAAGASSSVSLGDLASQKAQNTPSPADQAQIQADLRARVSAYRGAIAESKAAPPRPAAATESVQVEPANTLNRSLQTTHPISGFIAAPALRPRFRITDTGQLERSPEPGVWQPVPIDPAAKFRILAIAGSDIWAGGDHLRLFHSSDNGVTWTEVPLPATADHTHAIAHIRLNTAQKLTVESDNGATWTTTNAGTTWQ